MKKINKKQQRVNSEKMIAAIDIGKAKNWVIYRSPDGQESRPFEFSNTRDGFDSFHNQLLWFKERYHANDIVVGFESTGVYTEPLVHYLRSKGISHVLVNPVHSKRVKEIRDNSPNKTDKKDPRVIADLIQLGCVLSVIVPEGDGAELRHLSHARERAICGRNGLLSQLHDLVYKIFPEFHQVFKSMKSKSACYLLMNYPVPEDVSAADMNELASQLRSISRGRIKRSQVEEFHALAQRSIGVKEGRNAIVKEITHLVKLLQSQEAFIKDIEKEISETLRRIPVSQRILSIEGIGEVTTSGILGETACFQGMQNSKEIEKLAGLNLFEISSGRHQGQKRISKRGRSLLRKLLYFAALNVIKHDGVFRDKYQRYLKNGKPKNQGLIAVSRKLISVIFALVRDDVDFDLNHHQVQSHSRAA